MTTRDELAEKNTRSSYDGSWLMNPQEAFIVGFDAGEKEGFSQAIEEVLEILSTEQIHLHIETEEIFNRIKALREG